ncbi:MAG: hypothetical protein ACYCZD_04925 [Rhodanobacter sp.]
MRRMRGEVSRDGWADSSRSWLPLSLALPAIAPAWWRWLRERDCVATRRSRPIMADVMAPRVNRADARDMGMTSGQDWQLFRFDAVAPACRFGAVPRGKVEDWGGRDHLH